MWVTFINVNDGNVMWSSEVERIPTINEHVELEGYGGRWRVTDVVTSYHRTSDDSYLVYVGG